MFVVFVKLYVVKLLKSALAETFVYEFRIDFFTKLCAADVYETHGFDGIIRADLATIRARIC